MRFFDAINRWQVLVATIAVVAVIELGLYYFAYLPNRPPAAGPSRGQDLTAPVEDTAQTTVSKMPARRSTPPPSKTQYQP